jgi:hypothetical protein
VALSGGVATTIASSLLVGTHSITANYSGDSSFSSSTSLVLSEVITAAIGAATTTQWVTAAAVTYFHQRTPALFSVHVSSSSGTPTGTVVLFEGSVPLGPAFQLDGGGNTAATLALRPGAHVIDAVYSGDSNFNSSTSLTRTVHASPRPNPH